MRWRMTTTIWRMVRTKGLILPKIWEAGPYPYHPPPSPHGRPGRCELVSRLIQQLTHSGTIDGTLWHSYMCQHVHSYSVGV